MIYSEKVMEHFRNPRNVGKIENADGVGEVGNPVCGDMMTFYIKVKDNRLIDVKFQTFGCGAAIAVSSMVSEMAKGKTIEEALKITNNIVAEELGGLPKNKLHCSNLGADALHRAIEDYLEKKKKVRNKSISNNPSAKEEKCLCPYCGFAFSCDQPFCQTCQIEFVLCSMCHQLMRKEVGICPHCGAKKEGKKENA
ncbi:MAG: Fe-S cluster assembly scaffold protein NifU [Candidatus Aminicenantia bacterium]